MPMTPEDIMVGLQSLAASENMNPRQRDLMTEGAALIKFQQYRVDAAERAQKAAEDKQHDAEDYAQQITIDMNGLLLIYDGFQDKLRQLGHEKHENIEQARMHVVLPETSYPDET